MLVRLTGIAIAVMIAASTPTSASELYFDWNKRGARLPECGAAAVRAAVQRTVARADPHYQGDLSIKGLAQITQIGYSKNRPSPIARRYCRATAETVEAGKQRSRMRKLYYMIEEYQAFAGIGWNVEVCVSGRDRWYVYDARCRTVRP